MYVPWHAVSTLLYSSQLETYRRNLPGQINVLGQAHLALLERALEVTLLYRFATIRVLVDECDEAVLDLQVHLETLTDLLLEVACGLDAELLATVYKLAPVFTLLRFAKLSCARLRSYTILRRGTRTAWVDWGSGRPSQSSEDRRLGRRRSTEGCRLGPCIPP